MRAIAYFRADPGVSGVHPASQMALRRAFDEYCAAGGHINQGVFSDETTTNDTHHYQRMLDHIQRTGQAYLVIVPSAEHLGAELKQMVDRLLQLDALDCQVLCDSAEMPDPLQAAVRAAKTQGAAGARRAAIREGMKAKAARAMALGKPPFGYRIGVGGCLEPAAAQAEVVRSIFGMYLDQDAGVRTIARLLNEKGIRTRRGMEWSMVTVRDILRNHCYTGTYQRFGLRIPGSHEPIVSADEFRRVQDLMSSRSPGQRRTRAEPFLLAGILYCGHCGQRMMGVTRRQTWRRKSGERVRGEYRYYQCQSRINRSRCQYHTRRAAELEEQVLGMLRQPSPQTPVGEETENEAAVKRRSVAQTKLRGLERRYMEWVQRASDGMISLRQLRAALDGIETEQQALSMPDGDIDRQRQRQRQRLRLDTEWSSLNVYQRREVLQALISRVEIGDAKTEVALLG